MNTKITIFKINKIQHLVTICEISIFEISNLLEQNHFNMKANDLNNKFMQKLTLFLHDSGRFGSEC